MGNLIVNEFVKIFKRKSTYAMFLFLILIVVGGGFLTKYLNSLDEPVSQDNWKEELAKETEQMKKDLEEMPASMRAAFEDEIAINEYRIAHDLPPSDYNMWSFIGDSGTYITIVGLFVIIVAAGIVANEFSWGTIKSLIIKPYKRWKILLAKYVMVLLFMLIVLALLFISAVAVGAVLFGPGDGGSQIHLSYADGKVVEQSQLLYLAKSYLLNSVGVLLLATMAFMISTIFRSSGTAIGISVFLLLAGDTITSFFAMKFDWAKYILFANTNLMAYLEGKPMVEGMTMGFSITMLTIYFIVFQVLAFLFFTKRDVSN
ncbi:ABC transporter permease [Caldibacillus debilis]|jgi:ABC-2 type transport system permease protein|uniref:ABC transporter permease n=1 Tax=Caldibacillus debilis TaxID=301148 RepID=UPI000365400D|nr:ABC transporter permease [Caldibacillus debilis]